jgi:hypothetical protein
MGESTSIAGHKMKLEAIKNADAYLSNAGMLTYSELIALVNESARLGLTFDIGNAYIRRAYIDQQSALVARIDSATSDYIGATRYQIQRAANLKWRIIDLETQTEIHLCNSRLEALSRIAELIASEGK